MSKSIYIVNPAADAPSYYGAEMARGWGLQPATTIADLAAPTLAALVPEGFDIHLCDEHVDTVDLDLDVDYVALTGKVSQRLRMLELAAEFRRRGRTVLIGGPFASLCPEVIRPHCDVLVRGEIEEIAEGFFADLLDGTYKEDYEGTRPSLALSPPPRWDLYPTDRIVLGSVQTSRGCPFQCDFCDVIQYLGRKQRHKPIQNVLHELDELYRYGFRSIFLCDDNLTAARRYAKELLAALAEWNGRLREGKVTFSTQLSIDAAKDDELLRLAAEAGLISVFIGLETPNEESLRLARKRQNLGGSLYEQIQRFHDHGIMITGGMIVGFDGDGPDIFDRQYEFAMEAALPIVTLGALVAPAATPLHDRLEAEGRLVVDGSEVQAVPWSTNIVPRKMSRQELLAGVRALANRLYDPVAFTERMLRFISRMGKRLDPKHAESDFDAHRARRSVDRDGRAILQRLASLGEKESEMVYTLLGAVSRRPEAFDYVKPAIFHYAQIRYMYSQGQIWDEHVAESIAA